MSIIAQNILSNHNPTVSHKQHSINHFINEATLTPKNHYYYKYSIFSSKIIPLPTLYHDHKHSKTKYFQNEGNLSPKNYIFYKNPIFSSQYLIKHSKSQFSSTKAYENEGNLTSQKNNENFINLDTLLPILELLCIFPSTLISFGFFLKSSFFTRFGDKLFILQLGVLGIGLGIGVIIRERKWSKVLSYSKRGSESEKVNFVERIEKLEDDLKSAVTIVSVLSRQVEKLGLRFRVTRNTLKHPIAQRGSEEVNFLERIEKLEEDVKSSATIVRVLSRQLEKLGVRCRVSNLKEPITEAAALAEKNSEATRALAAQEEILEKELSEIQKVLLAMQDQQQKQLELILTIAKSGKLFDIKREPKQEQPHKVIETRKPTEARPNQMIKPHIKTFGLEKESNNDRA